jgi:GDPmannose 4,6-dehydratase
VPRKCFITGVTGQDGHYLARHLRREGATVYGLVRRVSRDTEHAGVPHGVEVVPGDVTDPATARIVSMLGVDEIYSRTSATASTSP